MKRREFEQNYSKFVFVQARFMTHCINKHRHAIKIIGYDFKNMHSGVVERVFAFNHRVFSWKQYDATATYKHALFMKHLMLKSQMV